MGPIRNYTVTAFLFVILCQLTTTSYGQLGVDLGIKKPKEYDNRTLRSERSDQKKFTLPRRLIQNTVTHYNYYFNANNKLNEVLEKAKLSFKDDYSALLPFYNYTLDATAADSTQLDSISYKSQTGIALHDLRGDWVDNLYLLWGASYYLKKQFDSAYLMFQFINYAFAKKEKDGYYMNIGSRMDGNTAFSIATKEKNSLPRRVFSEPPSRNDAFIWQIRNFLAQDQFAEAASLIITLRDDPQFPERLNDDLAEVQAYWFYKQNMWDSAAAHLTKALTNATNKQERARWEYLLAQLYERSGQSEEAEEYYSKAIRHTTDPILDIYARLFSIRVNKDGGENYIAKNIETLVKMAKRDKYQDYRDIIYYMAAQMELERNNYDGAIALLLKSTQYTSNDPSQRNKAFLQLAELSFAKKHFRNAYNFYDSLNMGDPSIKNPEAIADRKKAAGLIADNLEVIERQDSLQRIAALPEEERKDYVRKLVKTLRKQQGLKDEGISTGSGITLPGQDQTPLFPTNTKGEWYFYNASSRQKGLADFKTKWGTRPNQDNWRRAAAISSIIRNANRIDGSNTKLAGNAKDLTANEPAEITFDALYQKLPLTDTLMKQSNDSVQMAQFNLGKLYIQEIENCPMGTETLEDLRIRFPQHPKMDEVLFQLYYCYNKNGETAKAAAIKKLMNDQFTGSNFTTIVTTGKDPQSKTGNSEATKTYERIYDLFIEGKFNEAIAEKKIADSLYGKNHWTPQLLYIESVYYIKQRQDSIAKISLNNIISNFAQTPLAEKAATLLDVLGRRQQIEEELRKLVVNRPDEDTTTRYRPDAAVANNRPQQTLPAVSKDTVTTQKPAQVPPVAINNKPAADTVSKRPLPPATNYTFTPDAPHYVVLVLSKVDRVYGNEAKNAFARHNRDTYYSKQMTAELIEIDADNRLLIMSPFKNAQEAIDYIDKTKPLTASQIIPWLTGGKYYFAVITEPNLEVLKNSKDLDKYKQFLDRNFPGKF
ncbi:MAG: tetratricopeptide repeat protein [Chitinophagaceae bacterium]|nr:tetratricopeptide repeat protein [Chitinophagaceae bacterium]